MSEIKCPECGDIYGDGYPVWYSSVTKIYYAEKSEAIAATVAKLKEEVEDARNHKRNA